MGRLGAEVFGHLPDGTAVHRLGFGAGGLSASVLTLGAILNDVRIDGIDRSLTVGSDVLADYLGPMTYHGPIVGPVANRIRDARAVIGGETFAFEPNEGPTLLHSGLAGTHSRVWEVHGHDEASVTLRLALADGDGGFPGNRVLTARFEAAAPAALTLTITATTDAPTLINLTNHSYWQLGPDPRGRQTLTCPAESYVVLDALKCATGQIAPVAGTPVDFRTGAPVGDGRLDLCLCLAPDRRALSPACTLEAGGLLMEVATTEAGLQIYDGAAQGGLAIEAQNWPGAAHVPSFPTDRLMPGETRRQVTRWSFARA